MNASTAAAIQSDSKADAICLAGRVLATADVSAAVMVRFSDHRRLSTLLRLNSSKYDRKIVDLLHEAFVPLAPGPAVFQGEKLKTRLVAFAALLDGWSCLRADNATSQTDPVVFLTERMYSLRTAVVTCGFDPDSLDVALGLAEEDSTIAIELTAVVDELKFQLTDLEWEIDRHISDWLSRIDPITTLKLNEWRQQLRDCNKANG